MERKRCSVGKKGIQNKTPPRAVFNSALSYLLAERRKGEGGEECGESVQLFGSFPAC